MRSLSTGWTPNRSPPPTSTTSRLVASTRRRSDSAPRSAVQLPRTARSLVFMTKPGSAASPVSPADRYAAYMRNRHAADPGLAAFQGLYEFEFDGYQLAACRALADGHGVLLAAPTGSGKTVVGEFAVHLALAQGRKCFYTTPIKALSNQKYGDLVRRYGACRAGLLTGDNSINGAAQHALRRRGHPRRARVRRPRRGALPGRPVPGRGVGRGDHSPARVGAGGCPVRHGEQRRGVR